MKRRVDHKIMQPKPTNETIKSSLKVDILQPKNWPRPKGYANGVVASGDKTIFLAGLIGWDENEAFQTSTMVGQLEQILTNMTLLLKEAGAGPEHLVRMTWFITDKKEYTSNAREIGQIYRKVMGYSFPAMSVVEVKALMEDEAVIEIEATAIL